MNQNHFLKERIALISCLSYFHQCQIHEFKKDIELYFETLVSRSIILSNNNNNNTQDSSATAKKKSNRTRGRSTVTQYESTLLHSCLCSWIDWIQLCKHHDEECQKSPPKTKEKDSCNNASSPPSTTTTTSSTTTTTTACCSTTTTALAIILNVLSNQSIVHSCFSQTIVANLLHVAEQATKSLSYSFSKNNYKSHVETYLQQDTTTSRRRRRRNHHLVYPNRKLSASLTFIHNILQRLMESRCPSINFSNALKLYVSQSSIFQPFLMNNHQEATTTTTTSATTTSATTTTTRREMKFHLKTHFTDSKTAIAIEMLLFMKNFTWSQVMQKHLQISTYTSSSWMFLWMTILKMLHCLDDMDVVMLEYRKRKMLTKSHHYHHNQHLSLCTTCEMKYYCGTSTTTTTSGSNRKRKNPTSQVAQLHDEISDEEKMQRTFDLRRKPKRFNNHYGNTISHREEHFLSGSCTLKDVVRGANEIEKEMKEKQSCYLCMMRKRRDSSSQDRTTFPMHLVFFRAFLFHELVAILNVLSSNEQSGLKQILHQTLSMLLRKPESSSLRYCTILIAYYSESMQGYKSLLQILINSYKAHYKKPSDSTKQSNVHRYLELYCEIIIECSFFDEPREFWLAIKFLIDETTSIMDSQKLCSSIAQKGEVEFTILPYVAHIFLRRNVLALREQMSDQTKSSFNRYMMECSERFGEMEAWVFPMMSNEDRSHTVQMLQQLGVLSFLQSNLYDDDEHVQICHGMWPYVDSIRDASKRIGPAIQCLNLISQINYDVELNEFASKAGKSLRKRNREDSIADEDSILEYLNEDITRHIFSFLGYKLLVRVTAVCKLWNEIGNDSFFWKIHYKKRFKICCLYDFLPEETDDEIKAAFEAKFCDESRLQWRQMFDQKWKKERSLRARKLVGKRWPPKTCGILGCLSVVSTPKQHEQHLKMHKKDVAKKVKQLERSRARRKKQIDD